MSYKLWIDDDAGKPDIDSFRNPPFGETDWKVAHSSKEAKNLILEFGIPEFIEFDHDLGVVIDNDSGNVYEDTSMIFLHWFEENYPDAIDFIEGYHVHSRSFQGARNIESFMISWKKSRSL